MNISIRTNISKTKYPNHSTKQTVDNVQLDIAVPVKMNVTFKWGIKKVVNGKHLNQSILFH